MLPVPVKQVATMPEQLAGQIQHTLSALADPATSLKKPLLTARFAGTGGLEGPAEWDGQIRRRVWGRVWNLSGDPLVHREHPVG